MNVDRLRDLFELDVELGVLRRKTSPCNRVRIGDVAGADTGDGYLRVSVDGKSLRVHRVVFAMVNGYCPDQVDHINGLRADNRPSNLRAATQAQNLRNSSRPRHNKSGVKGVSWDKQTGKWRAKIEVDRKKQHIGRFVDLEDAVSAIRSAREKVHGSSRDMSKPIDYAPIDELAAERALFETAAYQHFVTRRAQGKLERQLAGQDGGDETPEALFWKDERGNYGVLMFNAAWWGWRAAKGLL